ncbi:DUF4097 family beta strand repeat-containing protein [Actinoplanes sp. TRM 88003]|uniref:DUF4097 family beta strand repeat-containing protein n=1 Tax=Paractinoplanes aksuensis TaxID=2939490 RepID=A0ABT1DIS1_9ACTN|nr:DUF4097 family beta strand repeat-containing protein [Actinoplanes aksuensis]MCO8270725.1 DUF4097 family beta strand repeat-containing protein [Actinoplanes aksuensis]
MPIFETPESISVVVELSVGNLRITASDRTDTVVDVRPSEETDESDVAAVQQVRVDFTDGTLRVIAPKRLFDFSRKTRSVDVSIELPSGSRVSAESAAGDLRCAGRLGECRLKTAAGDVSVEHTGPLRLSTSAGRVTAGRVTGAADVSTGSGKVQIGEVFGTAVVKNSNGETTIDAVEGDVRVRAANGDIRIERAGAGVDAKTANGAITIGEVVRGSVTLGTAMGDLDVGIAAGTAAWLELNTSFGHVRNRLDNTAKPQGAAETVEVRGRTSYGDITIHRS